MDTIALDDTTWYDEIRVRVPGADEAMIKQEIKSAIRTFADKSWAYLINYNAQDLIQGQATYTPEPDDMVVLAIFDVRYNGRSLSQSVVAPGSTSDTGSPSRVYVPNHSRSVTFLPTPAENETGVIDYLLAVKPDSLDDVPTDLHSHWFDVIKSGALYNLYSHPRAPYTNTAQASICGRMFYGGIASARDTIRKRYSRAELPWCYPRWAV